MHIKRSGKWGKAKRCEYGGHWYDSLFEAGYAKDLDLLKKAGEVVDWVPHVMIPLIVNGETITKYTIDFVVEMKDGTIEYVETKGYFDDYARLRWKLFQAIVPYIYPGAKCVLVKQGSFKPKRKWPKRKFNTKKTKTVFGQTFGGH